ncbi:hypothetical protein [Pseudogemmobacter faecipullorum]|uniref:Transposase n=1 Tax=Pseudogemmobacter faecipullorum TaxID=2755041 RepID=A0ABS8CR14_9RHOB|nr:hypothetical protein [Pseudogemmobacter faecipullorum]MCB5411809.1 hypothetical protein [Pseudogemmobacter faecipullorum]
MKIGFSHVRDDLAIKKQVVRDTGWKADDLPPRYSAFPNTRPASPRWEWRCFILSCDDGRKFKLLIEASPAYGRWKACLIKVPDSGPPVAIMRFEDQPGKNGGGVHIHAHCDQISDLCGADSIKMPYTLPDHRRYRRRRAGWTKALFCKAAGAFFRTDPIVDQEEMAL